MIQKRSKRHTLTTTSLDGQPLDWVWIQACPKVILKPAYRQIKPGAHLESLDVGVPVPTLAFLLAHSRALNLSSAQLCHRNMLLIVFQQ